MENSLISIVVPVYNAEKFIKSTIESVLRQTYKNWELIFVDDCSKDNSYEIIKAFLVSDNRIKYIKNKANLGPAITRNNGTKIAEGRFLCYLDADDAWDEKKLEKQINFMIEKNCTFSFTGYEFADKDLNPTGKKVFVPSTITYKQALKNTTIWTTTVMLDLEKISKENIYMPDVKSEDTASWWNILKIVDVGYGLNEILAYYRRTDTSLSANKFEAIKRIWNLYRNVEHLNIFYSFYNFCFYAVRAVLRRI